MFNTEVLIEGLTLIPISILAVEILLMNKNHIRRYVQYSLGLMYIALTLLIFTFKDDAYPDTEGYRYLNLTARSFNFDISDLRAILVSFTLLFLLYYFLIAPNILRRSDSSSFIDSEAMPSSLFVVIFTIFSGSLLTFFARDFITLFITLEITTFSFYVMMMNRSYCGSIAAQRASLRYFIVSAFSSILFLLSVVLSYTFAESVKFDTLLKTSISYQLLYSKGNPLLIISLLFFLASFAIKLGLPIFGLWTPSVYGALDIRNLALLSTVMKLPVLYTMGRMLLSIYDNYYYIWSKFLIVILVVGMLTLPVVMLNRSIRLRELIAYSSIFSFVPTLLPFLNDRLVDINLSFSYYISYLTASFLLFASINHAMAVNGSMEDTVVKVNELGKFFTDRLSKISFVVSMFAISGFPLSLLWLIKLRIFNSVENMSLLLLLAIVSSSILFIAYLFPCYELMKSKICKTTKKYSYTKWLLIFLLAINIILLFEINRYTGLMHKMHILL